MNRTERTVAFFSQVGDLVARAWRDAQYSDGTLPAIAERILLEQAPHKSVSSHDVIEWALRAPALHESSLDAMREGPLTIYRGKRFHIDVIFSLGATTSIHGHDFEGAFCVLGGTSVHTTYTFNEEKRLSSRLQLGDVRFQSAELTEPGTVRIIRANAGSIHSVFHLDSPSVTIYVRTSRSTGLPQYEYFPPYLAIAPADMDPQALRTIQLLGTLRQIGSPNLAELVAFSIDNTDDLGAYKIFNTLNQWNLELEDAPIDEDALTDATKRADIDRVRSAYAASRDAAARKFGEDAIALFQVSRLEFLTHQVMNARRGTTNAEHRFFLALLMNVPSRVDLLRLVGLRFPGDPVKKVMGWLRELMTEQIIPFEMGDDMFSVLESDLLGVPAHEHLARIHGRELTREELGTIESSLDLLRGVAILRPLFDDEVWASFASLRATMSSV